MRECHLAALAVIDRAAIQIPADSDANDHGSLEAVIRAPSDRNQLVANLHHGWPDVINELNLGNRFQSPLRHTNRPANNRRFCQGTVEAPRWSEFALQAVSCIEYSTLSFNFLEVRHAAAICDIFAENNDVRVA